MLGGGEGLFDVRHSQLHSCRVKAQLKQLVLYDHLAVAALHIFNKKFQNNEITPLYKFTDFFSYP